MLKKILGKFNLLCLNEKDETYYRAFDGCKSTIDLAITNLALAPQFKWTKEYELGGSDHFPIIIEDEREVSIKQQQRWSIGKANWAQFQKEGTITTKVQYQSTIEEAHSRLVETILQAAEKSIPKTSSETKRRPYVAWWNKECKKEERIVRAEYRKH